MKKRIAMCAVCFCMLEFFLCVGFDAQNALAAQEISTPISCALSASCSIGEQPAEDADTLAQDILINELWIKEHWYSEKEYLVSLYQKASGENVICVSDIRGRDNVLQEAPLSLPGELLEMKGFLADGPDVVISCGEESGDGVRYFLYLWNEKACAFDAEPIELPTDYMPRDHAFLRIFSRTRQEGPVSCKTLYQVDEQTKNIVEIRSYALDREEMTLEIRDSLRNRSLFSGSVLLDEDGNLQNEAYYDYFFGSYSYVTKPWEPDPNIAYEEGIPVFFEEPDEYGYHTVYYPDRETFLSEQGFSGQEPFYRYMNTWGDLEVELYYDTATETGCGFYYDYEFYPEQEQIITGYVFQGIEEQPWETYPPYALENRYGETGKEYLGDGEILSYEEDSRYRADGRPEYFRASGLADFYRDEPKETTLLELNFVYRDDGSLACRRYSYNSLVWGSSYSSGEYLYDEAERLAYENLYVTHGGMSFYYIYEDGSDTPVYALMLDNCGSWGCGLFMVE